MKCQEVTERLRGGKPGRENLGSKTGRPDAFDAQLELTGAVLDFSHTVASLLFPRSREETGDLGWARVGVYPRLVFSSPFATHEERVGVRSARPCSGLRFTYTDTLKLCYYDGVPNGETGSERPCDSIAVTQKLPDKVWIQTQSHGVDVPWTERVKERG